MTLVDFLTIDKMFLSLLGVNMKRSIAVLFCLAMLMTNCNKNGGIDLCNSNQAQGTDGQCYSCSVGTPETAGNTFGYCSGFNGAGVACCSSTYTGSYGGWGGVTCYSNEPWLCSDGLCHTSNTGACVYVP